jgi:hypothetical protein
MSVPTHRSPRSRRPRRWRAASAVIATAVLTLATAGIAMADDVAVDNDVVTPGVQHSADITVAPGDPVSATAQMVVDYQGSKHLTSGSAITVGLEAGSTTFGGVTGVSVGDATGTVPVTWEASSPNFTLSSQISFNAPTAPGTYHLVIHYIATSYTCDSGDDKCLSAGTGDPFLINLTVETPAVTNTAPVVAFTNPPTTADEGDTKTFTFSITDPNAGDTHSFASGYPDCGTGNLLVSSSIDQAADTGSFSCTFVDGLVPAVASTVKVRVSDDAPSTSNEVTTAVTVNNLAPVVAAPAFSVTSIDCRVAVTLSGISFSDAGVNDLNWSVDINWADGSPHTTYSTGTQGVQANQSHTYNAPGTYSATVTVTDKDTGVGSAASTNSVVVNQVYTTDFLPPFDDSTPSGLIVNQMKNGRTVPVKATIYDVCAQAYVTSPAVVTIGVKKTTVSGTPTPDAVETYADAGASSSNTNLFRWNADSTSPTGGFWIYNLDSKALALVTNSYYRVDIYVGGVQATKTNWGVLQPVK